MMHGHFIEAARPGAAALPYVPHTSWLDEPGVSFRFRIGPPSQTVPDLPGMVRASRLKQSMVGPDAPLSWVHLCLYGTWDGHSSGRFSFSDAEFNEAIGNFDRLLNAVPYTQGHPETDTPAPAWVRQLAVVGNGSGQYDGLYALTEWTASTAAQVREGAWKFCSVHVRFKSIDRQTNKPIGCELIQVGLTNNPFLDGQKPIALSRFGAAEKTPMTPEQILHAFVAHCGLVKGVRLDTVADMKKEIDACAKLFGMPKGTTLDKIIARLNAMQAYIKSEEGAGADSMPADAEAAMSSKDAAKCAATWRALGAVKLDGSAPAPAPVGDGGADNEAAEGKLLDTLMSIMTKAGITDPTAQQQALDANADAIASLLTGGTPMSDEKVIPTNVAASRATEMLRVELAASKARDLELSAEVAKLTADLAARTKAEADALEAKRLADEAAVKLAAETKLAAQKTEADALIKEAVLKGTLLLKAARGADGKITRVEAGSEVEHWRKMFALDHDTAKAALSARMPIAKPAAGPVVTDNGDHPTPPPLAIQADEIDLSNLSDIEKTIIRGYRGADTQRRLIANWRAKQALRDAS